MCFMLLFIYFHGNPGCIDQFKHEKSKNEKTLPWEPFELSAMEQFLIDWYFQTLG